VLRATSSCIPPPMKITIVAFEGCMTSAVFGQADAFAVAAYMSERRADSSWSGHDVRLATPGGKPVRGYGGHLIEPDCSLVDADDSHVVLIPPIFNDIEQTLAQEGSLVSWLASFPANSKLLASTCTGAFLLAEAASSTAGALPPIRPLACFSSSAIRACAWHWTNVSSTTTWSSAQAQPLRISTS
jgi:transcriptional regulator GlxA family with amidase domain